jgi:hypothetical protein
MFKPQIIPIKRSTTASLRAYYRAIQQYSGLTYTSINIVISRLRGPQGAFAWLIARGLAYAGNGK